MGFEPGRYRGVIKEQGWQESKSGKAMIVFKVAPLVKLVPGPEGTDEHDVDDGHSVRTIRLVLEGGETQLDYAMKKLRHAGFTGSSFSQIDLVERKVECMCEASEYQGKQTEQWDLALPPLESKPLSPIDSKQARKLDAIFGKRLKDGAAKAAPDPQREPVGAGGSAQPPDDEVPF